MTQIPTSAPTDGEQAEGHHERPLRARKALIREQHSVKLLSSNDSLRMGIRKSRLMKGVSTRLPKVVG
ncbi:hypothetical protein, partial [Pseudomonas aeruginosa]|uniref:hypothetical protein n=1 Tax=Pseudomonas aeruginosa TaxID=287 RepID=UPI003F1E1E15